jgi:heme-degrading monooxygenase HmoA
VSTPERRPATWSTASVPSSPSSARSEGHRRAYLLQRNTNERVSLLAVTLWDSMDAVRAFAGDGPERAVVEPAARTVLSAFDKTVDHYEVVLDRPA